MILLNVEDDQYVKNRKVSKKKLKQFDNVDPRTYAFFDCDMSCKYTIL